MNMNWLSRVTQTWTSLLGSLPAPDHVCEWDADARRARIDLDAIRVRFPDHA